MRARSHHPELTADSRPVGVALLALLALVALTYVNGLPGSFVLDDQTNVIENGSIRRLSALSHVLWPPVNAGVGGRPLANLTLALNFAMSGIAPWSYHATNIAVHAAATLALFGIVRRTLALAALQPKFERDALMLSFAAAAAWATHPLATAVVDYVSQRTEQLMALCALLTLYAFIRAATAPNGAARWVTCAVAACAAGMASKEVMVTAPLLVLLYDRAFLAGSLRAAWRARGRWHLAIAASWLLLAGLMLASRLAERGVGFGGVSPLQYALTECHAVLLYAARVAWPAPLVFDYGWSFSSPGFRATAEALIVLATLAVVVWAVIRRPRAGFAAAWFIVVLAPTSSVVPIVHQPIAESRVYLALAGVVAAAVLALFRVVGRAALVPAMAAVLAGAVTTFARNADYRNPITLWRDTVAKRPDNARAYSNLAGTLLNEHRPAEVLDLARTAVRLRPEYADAHVNLGAALAARGQIDAAREQYETAVRIEPTHAGAQANLGNALMLLGREAEARAPLEAALRLNPNLPQPHNDLGVLLLDRGDFAGSLAQEEAAVRLAPAMSDAHYNRANALARLRRLPEALAAYDEALRLRPDFAKAYNNRGVVLLNLGRPAEAAESFAAALRCDPSHREAPRNLEAARRMLKIK